MLVSPLQSLMSGRALSLPSIPRLGAPDGFQGPIFERAALAAFGWRKVNAY